MDLELPILGAPPRSKPHRQDLAPGDCLCNYCTAKCCRYFALPLDTPTTWKDFDFLRWFLLHERASAFVEDGTWYLLVHTLCRHLRADNLCGIYETRPNICRAYKTTNCEYEDDWVYDHYLETAAQVEEYALARLGPRRGQSFRSPKPAVAKSAPQKRTSSKSDRGASAPPTMRAWCPACPAVRTTRWDKPTVASVKASMTERCRLRCPSSPRRPPERHEPNHTHHAPHPEGFSRLPARRHDSARAVDGDGAAGLSLLRF